MVIYVNIHIAWEIPWTEEPGGLHSFHEVAMSWLQHSVKTPMCVCVCVCVCVHIWTSLVAQMVKNPPAMWETCIQSLGQEDPLEKEMATHSSLEPGRLQSTG